LVSIPARVQLYSTNPFELLFKVLGKRLERRALLRAVVVFDLGVLAVLEATTAALVRTSVKDVREIELLSYGRLSFANFGHVECRMILVPRDQLKGLVGCNVYHHAHVYVPRYAA